MNGEIIGGPCTYGCGDVPGHPGVCLVTRLKPEETQELESNERLTATIADLERKLAAARAALKCQVCGKLKAYTAICFDCLGEDVEEIARWHREVELSDGDGTSDICSQCHTGWPCDAIKALKLLAEAQGKLEAVRVWSKKPLHQRFVAELHTILGESG